MTGYDMDFEDDRANLNKDAQTRRRYLRWFNKRREDFATDLEYDNYLEMVEEIIYNIVNNINVEETKARVDKYRRENQDLIGQNQAKRMDEERLEAERVSQAERARIAKLAELRKQDEEMEQEKLRLRKQLEAEELLRASKGEEAFQKHLRRKEKAERKKRKKEAAAARAAEERDKPDIAPMWFRPNFPTALPVPVGTGKVTIDQRPELTQKSFDQLDPAERARAAAAAGFQQRHVYQRALAEFNQSLELLQL